jgi:hypothetical protein
MLDYLSENHYKINLITCEDLMKVLSPFCGSLLTPPCWVDRSPISHCDWPKLMFFFILFLHPSYTAIMNGQSGTILNSMLQMIN